MLDAHAAQEVAGGDVDGVGILTWALHRLVTGAADETVALDNHIDVIGHKQFNTTEEGVDIYLLVLVDGSPAQVKSQSAAEGVQPRSVESFTFIDILIASKADSTADALTVFTQRQGTL